MHYLYCLKMQDDPYTLEKTSGQNMYEICGIALEVVQWIRDLGVMFASGNMKYSKHIHNTSSINTLTFFPYHVTCVVPTRPLPSSTYPPAHTLPHTAKHTPSPPPTHYLFLWFQAVLMCHLAALDDNFPNLPNIFSYLQSTNYLSPSNYSVQLMAPA